MILSWEPSPLGPRSLAACLVWQIVLIHLWIGLALIFRSSPTGKNKKKKPEAPKAERVAFDANTCMCNDASGKKSTWDDCFQCCDTRGYSVSTLSVATLSNWSRASADSAVGLDHAMQEQLLPDPG